MKFFILTMISLSFAAFAFGGIERNRPSEFQVIPLNSPVKERTAKFSLKAPQGFEIQSIKFRIQKASEVLIKETNYSSIKLVAGSNGQELHIPLEGATPGFYRLFVKVKNKNDNIEELDFKTVFKDFVNFIVAEKSSGVPMPDPSQNNATLGGVDSDYDGIRDDIQIWIDKEFTNNIPLRNGMKQLASSLQTQILSTHDPELSNLATRIFLRSMSCMTHLVGIDQKMRLKNKLKEKALNTKDRLKAEIKANEHFSGQGLSVSIDPEYTKSQCDF